MILAILAAPAAGWADLDRQEPADSVPPRGFRVPNPPQQSPTADRGTVTLNHPAKNPCLLSSAEIAQGYGLMRAGGFAEGRAKLQSALEEVERRVDPDPVHRARLMNLIGFAASQQRWPDLAVEWYQRALEIAVLPDALMALLTTNLATANFDLNRLERAEELALRAIRLSVDAFGPDDSETLFPQVTLALVHVARGEYARAEPVLRRALDQAKRSWGTSSYEVSLAAGNLAFIHFVQGRYALAGPLFEESLAALEGSSMRAKDEIPVTQAALSVCYAARGRHREANMWLERALASAHGELTPEDLGLAVVLERGATTRFLLKDYEAGRQLFERAITILEAHYGPRSQAVLNGLERYSVLLRTAKDKTGTRKLEELRKALALKR